MTTQDLLCKIKKLEKIEPDEAWIRSNKAFIFDYIEAQELKQKESFVFSDSISNLREKAASIISGLRYGILMPAASAMVVMLLAGGFVVAKSNDALPGDALYGVKILTEKFQVALTFSDEKRATLNFELAEKRLNELSVLVGKDGKENNPAVGVAMQNFKSHLDSAASDLDNFAKSEPDKALTVAKIADSKTADYAQKMKKTETALNKNSKDGTNGQVADVMSRIEEINIKALSVLASANGQSIDADKEADQKEIALKVEEKIKSTEEKIESVQQKVPADDSLASKLIEQATEVLSEAKADLAANDASKALEKVVVSNEMTQTAEKMVIASVSVSSEPVMPAASVKPSLSPTVILAAPVPSLSPSVSPSVKPVLSPSVSPLPEVTLTPSISPTPEPVLSPSVSPAPKPEISPTPTPPLETN